MWYRARYLHDGSVASLEEMFNPDRLKESHVPGGFRPLGMDARAIPGHTFGLNLKPVERQQLIAFLKSGFPFEHDQWISAAATGWAVEALARSIEVPAAGLRETHAKDRLNRR